MTKNLHDIIEQLMASAHEHSIPCKVNWDTLEGPIHIMSRSRKIEPFALNAFAEHGYEVHALNIQGPAPSSAYFVRKGEPGYTGVIFSSLPAAPTHVKNHLRVPTYGRAHFRKLS
jgi:hypothetical protein